MNYLGKGFGRDGFAVDNLQYFQMSSVVVGVILSVMNQTIKALSQSLFEGIASLGSSRATVVVVGVVMAIGIGTLIDCKSIIVIIIISSGGSSSGSIGRCNKSNRGSGVIIGCFFLSFDLSSAGSPRKSLLS